jgi:hypothetical protein
VGPQVLFEVVPLEEAPATGLPPGKRKTCAALVVEEKKEKTYVLYIHARLKSFKMIRKLTLHCINMA